MTAALLLAHRLLAAAGAPAPPAADIVAAVRVEAPADDVPRLARYLGIPVGEPLDPARVRHAVELLYATGEFQDVVVETRQAGAGLEVVFRPVPAPLLARVRVDGDRVLSTRAIRRITRLTEGEPLWPARLERAGRDVALALVAEGYLEAQVGAESRPPRQAPPARANADAVFRVRAGPRARVSALRIDGAEPHQLPGLRDLARPRIGEVFREARAVRAADAMRRRLLEGGRWRASVERTESYDPRTAGVALAFEVSPGPRTYVEFRGARLPGPLRARLEALLRDGGLKGDVLEEAAERLEEDFRSRGHRDAAVSRREESRPAGQVIVYEIAPGPVALVASVTIAGEGTEGLAELVNTRAAEPMRDALVEADVQALTTALEERGHIDPRVEAEVLEGGGYVPVLYRVRAGPRTIVTQLTVEAPAPPPAEGASRELRLRPGLPYRSRDLAQDRDTLLATYRNAGFLDVEVKTEVAFSEDRTEARVVLHVSPGAQTRVDHVVIAGLRHTRDEVVLRELSVQEGLPLGLQKVLDSQRRLGALGIFQRVTLSELDPETEGRRSIVVSAEEAPRTTIAYGIGYAERDLVRGSLEVTQRNLFGMDRSLSTFARGSFRGSRFLATFREPYLLGRRQDLFVTGFREEEDRVSFDFVRYGGLLQTARSFTPSTSVIVRYSFQETDVFQVEVPLDELDRQFRTSTVSGPSASIVNDTRDDPLDPRRGHFVGADVQFSHAVLGGDSFLKSFVQASGYQRLTARVLLALSSRVGLARTFGLGEPLLLPLPDRFFAGGDYSLRGYATDTAGPLVPSATGRLVPTGGNALLVGGAELRLDAGRNVSIAVFSEAGNVYPLVSDMDLGSLRYTAGLGLRYKSALGPLRIDWGYKLNRRDGESSSRVHFTVGHAF
jgi:outer membrane protein insertion porin family